MFKCFISLHVQYMVGLAFHSTARHGGLKAKQSILLAQKYRISIVSIFIQINQVVMVKTENYL